LLPREAAALAAAGLPALAAAVTAPRAARPRRGQSRLAHDITRSLNAALRESELTVLPGLGHEAIDSAPELVSSELQRFLR
jgi:hypothetical protein